MQPVLVPTGEGYLQRVLRDPRARSRLDVSALPKFSQMVMRAPRMGRWRRLVACVVLQDARDEPEQLFRFAQPMPGSLVEIIAELALLADIRMSAVTAALLSYGIEAVARELRSRGTLPAPCLPPPKLVGRATDGAGVASVPLPPAPPSRPPLPRAFP